MFDALGYAADDPRVRTARAAIEKLLVVKEDEAYCQPCLSPVWDTALAAHTLLEVGGEECERRTLSSLRMAAPVAGARHRSAIGLPRVPHVRPGGWAFQYANPHYPDLDDTAVVVMAMDRIAARLPRADDRHVPDSDRSRAQEWVVGMQSENGGWAAFDADNEYYYLNQIPFADHGALLDPPTADVTARCVSMLAQLGASAGKSEPLDKALAYLLRTQEKDGSWYGRWGMNYVYGTWSVLCALNAARVEPSSPADTEGRRSGCSRSRIPTAAGARAATATSSTIGAMSLRRARHRRRRGPSLG